MLGNGGSKTEKNEETLDETQKIKRGNIPMLKEKKRNACVCSNATRVEEIVGGVDETLYLKEKEIVKKGIAQKRERGK